MKLGIGDRVLRVMTAAVTTISITIVSCTAPVTPPVGGQGPQFVINGPVAGGFTAGTFFFSVQPFDPSSVQRVDFAVDGVAVGSDSTADDGFRVAIAAGDYAAGEIELQATVVGTNGHSRTGTITVENVPQPVSSGTVGSDGLVLGTARGSTLAIRPGDALGANISFTEQTQEQVKVATGIDYAALGVTFLGAQEIDSDLAIESPTMVSSADFASFVQGGQAIVNYLITPDADGDGIGELVVVNSASVAGDDVISDPVPELQLGQVQIRNLGGTATLRTHQQGISGPPGTILTFAAAGFNALSAFGNIAIFESQGETMVVSGVVTPELDGVEARFTVMIPPLPQGPATMTIVSNSAGSPIGPIDLFVEALPIATAADEVPGIVLEAFLIDTLDLLATLPADEPGSAPYLADTVHHFSRALTDLQQLRATLAGAPDPQVENILLLVDQGLSQADVFGPQARAGIVGQELSPEQDQLIDDIATAFTFVGAVMAIIALAAPAAAVIAAGIALGVATFGLYRMIERRFRPGCKPAINALEPYLDAAEPLLAPLLLSGMGSAAPSGGSGCGTASGGDLSSGLTLQQLGVGPIVVKIFVGGSPLPFAGVADVAGYFFIPIIPEGEPFTAVATATESNEVRIVEGIGPALGESVYLVFDFLNADDALPTVPLNANTSGDLALDETDLYTFVGSAGQLVGIGTQGAPDFVEQYKLDLFGPASSTDLAPAVGSGIFYSETGVLALPDSGSYTLSVASNFSASGAGSGAYHVGLSEIAEPTAIALGTSPVTVDGEQTVYGDRHFYSFSAQAGDLHKFSLSLPAGSLFNAELNLLGPGPEPFYARTNLIGSGTFVLDTRPVAVTAPFVVPESGAYVLEIERGGSSGTIEESLGAWSFSVLTPAPATAIFVGNSVNGSIGLPGEIDLFTFTATAGQNVDFQTQDLDAEVDQVNWSVSAPDGSVIFDAPLFSDPGTFTLAQAGTYTVMVGSDNDAGTGAYTFSLTNVP